MQEPEVVHKKRTRSKGVRMDAELWEFVDDLADVLADGSASQLIAMWVSEKRDTLTLAVK